MRGYFNISSNSNKNYEWHYEYNESVNSFCHVVRPLFITESKIRFWEFITEKNIKENIEISLESPDIFELNEISIIDNTKVYITVTWKLSVDNWLLKTVSNLSTKTENNLNLIQSFENKDFTEFLSECDDEFDDLILFLQKMTNYVQILQDDLNNESDINDKKKYINNWLTKIKSQLQSKNQLDIINKKITYIGINDTL
tara:strand:+ start:140 stop:736 length:597 start_codon:yes stop_codon:yes gene_type:complete